MLIKDLEDGEIFEYGNNSHDSLTISDDGRTLSYYNLQNGDGSKYGNYRFVMEDGEVPSESNTADAMYGCCYAHIGYTDKDYKKGRADAYEECARMIETSKTLFENHQTETIMVTKDKCIAMIRNSKEQKWQRY